VRVFHIGFLSPATGGFFFGDVLSGVTREVAAAGGRLTVIQTGDAGWAGRGFTTTSSTSLPAGWAALDGFVTIVWATSPDQVAALRAAGKPVVVVSSDIPVDAATVAVDNRTCILEAVAHLKEHGHAHVAFVGSLDQSDIRERHAACQDAAAENGLTFTFVPAVDQIESGGAFAAPAVAEAWRDGVTAIVAATDQVALGLIKALAPLGLKVPDDLAIIGFDDFEGGWTSEPPLATVRQDFEGEGSLAAHLLLSELSGVDVPHERYVAQATFIQRGSCGCRPGAGAQPTGSARDGTAVADLILRQLAIDETAGNRRIGVEDVDLDDLEAVIKGAVGPVFAGRTPPEDRRSFTEAFERRLTQVGSELAAKGIDIDNLVHHIMRRLVDTIAQRSTAASLARFNLFGAALDEQFNVATRLLDNMDRDPSELEWMDVAPVRAACLGLWEGPREDASLRICGVYDPTGALGHLRGKAYRNGDFPPIEIRECPEVADGEIAHVIPVRGTTGDYGLLCVLGRPDDGDGRDRSTYNHWAVLLGIALRDKFLLDEVQHSERRHAAVARAANDGLWEWDATTGDVYLSGQCRDLLDLPIDLVADAETIVSAMHSEDHTKVRDTLRKAVGRTEVPVATECRVVRHDGTVRWVLVRALGVATTYGGARGLVGSVSDIDQRKALEERLRHAASFDEVTGLPNRRLFLDRLRIAVEQRRRRETSRFAVLFLDLDGFKLVNDSLGHLVGDQLLQVVAERLKSGLRAVDTAARFGGDEFAILLTDPVPEDLLVVTRRIQDRIATPVTLSDQEVSITASIGIATADTGYLDPEDVLRDADIAMYRAKETEHGSACLFDPAMHQRALDRLRIRTAVVIALDNHEFVVHYQPIIDFDDTTVTRFEALVRWQHPARGLLLPGEFLPSMEGNTSIVTLGRQVLDDVCAQIAEWRRDGDGDRPVNVSVNVSHREFWSPDFLTNLRATLDLHGVPPQCLSLELTEGIIMTDPDEARNRMRDLHALGIRLHIDDFGTGHSSLNLLRTFPVDTLKIDGSFIRDLTIVDQAAALVRAIIVMSAALGMSVIAECVETHEQTTELRNLGCTTAQGWLYARAMPADEAGRILGTRLQELIPQGRDSGHHPAQQADAETVPGGNVAEG
jgi:diguanylate cyclase (GGDEF)-like protein/PAS domain S-box-containing protein